MSGAARIPTTVVTLPNGVIRRSSAAVPLQGAVQTGDRALDEVQTRMRAENAPAGGLPFGNGNMIKGVAFVATVPKVIQHGLGKPYAGYLVMNIISTAADVLPRRVTPDPDGALAKFQITLTAAVTCTADVWVYA